MNLIISFNNAALQNLSEIENRNTDLKYFMGQIFQKLSLKLGMCISPVELRFPLEIFLH